MSFDDAFKEKEIKDNNKRIKVMVAIPHMGWITVGLETKIAHWITESDYDIEQFFSTVKPTYANRNIIAKKFLDSDCDYLLSIDSDVVPTTNPLKLIEHGVDIVGGVYPTWKDENYLWLAVWRDTDGSYKQYVLSERKGLKEVDALGTGCLLTSRKVIEALPAPFVDKVRDEIGDRELGHDLYFCLRAKDRGFKVYADFDIVCDHVKELPLIPVINTINEAFKEGYEKGKKEGLAQ